MASLLVWSGLSIGLAASAMALYGRYRVLPAFLTGPAICRLEDNGCAVLFRTPVAAVLGVPNAFLGILLYLWVAAILLLGYPVWLAFGASSAGLAMSAYLAFRLIRDRLECRVCWTGHAANLLLWVGLFLKTLGSSL
ncbi:MAG TPA: vitamin K epoxide reductase family protein [Thermoanaerobaculia bacterium]